jgi:histidyl-tRNA synthetase
MASIQAPRGTRDILPEEIIHWQTIEEIARTILRQAAYREVRTPIFEYTDLFERGIGEATDVVGKEMYTFSDKSDRSLTLRPEGTAGAVRAYIEHGLHAQGGVQRLWYTGPMFRYERPKAGRQRQFHQLGVEVLGSANPRADAEVISLALDLFGQLGLKDLRVELNSVGTASDRQVYRTALVEYLTPYRDSLDADSQDRLTRNPLRILDSKDAKTQKIVQDAPSILDYLSADSKALFERVQDCLTHLGIAYHLNPRLVRGLDYYTHTAFEIQSDALGTEATICGGGRYDGLVAELGGPVTPAVGWALGLERLVLLVQQLNALSPVLDVYCVARGELAELQALALCQQLRQAGVSVEMDLSGSAFGKQLKRADRSGAALCLILGEEEAQNQTVHLKWLTTGEQILSTQTALIADLDAVKAKIALTRLAASR